MRPPVDLELGARVADGGVCFRVWAPRARTVAVRVDDATLPMSRSPDDVFETHVPGLAAGADYLYVVDGERARPDPASRWQPRGVHGPSRVVDPAAFHWHDHAWRGVARDRLVLYELHVGTFTPAGTFAAAIAKLGHLVELGITAVELMPIAEFPGGRNWGYDGVYLFAPQSTYGGPDGLRLLVDACHAHGLAVILDVVHNHVGPEGNYLADFAPYASARHRTPWGAGLNLDDADADGVRCHLISSAVAWIREYHVDGLRLDAVHRLVDASPRHFLAELADEVRVAAGDRAVHVIAESNRNDVRIVQPAARGGHGLDAQWSDDFHDALYAVLTGDRRGHRADLGGIDQLGKAIVASFVHDGGYSPQRRRRHGSDARDVPGEQFVVFLENHDQIANGSQGRRLTDVVGPRAHAAAAALLFTTPDLPLVFMGEELAATTPFHYFTSHGDPALATAVRDGRARELGDLGAAAPPDPQDEAIFAACKLDWSIAARPPHAAMLALYRDLLALRRDTPCLAALRKDLTSAWWHDERRWIVVERRAPGGAIALVLCNLAATPVTLACPGRPGTYRLALATDDDRYGGPGVPADAGALELADGAPPLVHLPAHTARIYLGGEP